MITTKTQSVTTSSNGIHQKKEVNDKTHSGVYHIFFSLLLDLLAFTIILPLLPTILERYRHDDSSGLYIRLSSQIRYFQEMVGAPDKYSSVLFGGFLGSMFSFLQFVVSPIMGALSDCYGRKPILLISLIGISFSYVLWALSSNFFLFVLARFVGGLSKGNIALSMAIITDVSDVKNRGKAMALVGIAFSIGFIIGPMIGALFSIYTDKTSSMWFWYPASFAFLLSLADVLFVYRFFNESLPKEKRSKQVIGSVRQAFDHIDIRAIFNFVAVKNLKKNELYCLKQIGLIYFIYLFIYSGLEFTITFLMYHKLGYTSVDQAKMFVTTGVVMAILQGSVVRRLPPQCVKPSAVFGLYLIVPAFILVGLADDSKFLYAGMILFAVSTAFVVTCMTTLISEYGTYDQKGVVLGIFRSIGALARALGPIFASIAFWGIGASFTYIVGGILLLIPTFQLQFLKLTKLE
ncbi:major facilitator superfamily domain-containing protein 10 [Contarinia nasturtii]|uniref:major facilitator superfamily domain-containing protein 10 n=1 Tax=Contarinia nasturtii TaxID=265458 RepID=UPI0012D467F7|nr:major facilitator superfamily domain-containing protein 10 [Contarinia nasturtii]XP_031617919.1 major facilitator superfamily domain-containing protein 10 [Contarinia nasturtii]XP_031617920.1 major facilitator superfamily domain-containing protein 10 [Contarinia nasturtii]XP_031617921.1 major facilitator superfamily domain-containing protein 10 [Contarinia nasturtii]XP_031617922.1 major facilitator superfamily domain-containing protein 10 [Contarinia nasturtii]XP_031617923.1 major facilitat